MATGAPGRAATAASPMPSSPLRIDSMIPPMTPEIAFPMDCPKPSMVRVWRARQPGATRPDSGWRHDPCPGVAQLDHPDAAGELGRGRGSGKRGLEPGGPDPGIGERENG